MRNCLVMIFVFLSLVSSFPLEARKKIVAFDLTPFAGYRQDNVKWKTQPGSTLKWKNLQGIEYGIKTTTTLRDRYFMDVDFGFANFLGGTMSDSNYLAAPLSGNPAHNTMNLNSGFAFSPNLAFGINTKPFRSLDFKPLIGIDYNYLNLTGKKSASALLTSLSNTLQFYGPYVGFDSKTKFTKRLFMTAGGAFSLAFYHGSGHWKFQNNKTNNTMHQGGSGLGLKGQIGLQYTLVQSVTLGGEVAINWNRIYHGHDTRHFANDGGGRVRLNNVNWTSFSGRIVLTKSF
jgi:hypothetical protein